MKPLFEYRLKKIARLARGKILDVGFSLFPNYYLRGEVIGVDITIPDKKPRNYSSMIKADICKLPFKDNSIDTIILGGIIEHLENPMAALREVNRVLKQNGILLIETPNPYYLPVILSDLMMHLKFYFYDTHINLFPRRIMLKMLWHCGFSLNEIEGCGINLSESLTIPMIQQFSQDLIYIAMKKKAKGKILGEIRKLRTESYEKL